ncbi:hypothetical protein OAI33_04705 [Pirellulaceae bacterium]|jgi:hypothetical protein|nr:hypothetical protein [Pirellulaceae bacterium]
MIIKSLVQKLTGEAKLQEVGENIAQSCANIVWNKIGHRVHEMTTPQAQGYVRGRAGRSVKVQLEQALIRNGIHELRRTKLMDVAMNSLIGLMLERKHEQQRVPAVIRKAA